MVVLVVCDDEDSGKGGGSIYNYEDEDGSVIFL